MTIRASIANQVFGQLIKIDFGVADRLGRAIGISVCASEFDYVAFVEDPANRYTSCYSAEELGRFFRYSTQSQRNGKPHQASHSSPLFKTAAERDKAMAKAVDGARKRALAPAARERA